MREGPDYCVSPSLTITILASLLLACTQLNGGQTQCSDRESKRVPVIDSNFNNRGPNTEGYLGLPDTGVLCEMFEEEEIRGILQAWPDQHELGSSIPKCTTTTQWKTTTYFEWLRFKVFFGPGLDDAYELPAEESQGYYLGFRACYKLLQLPWFREDLTPFEPWPSHCKELLLLTSHHMVFLDSTRTGVQCSNADIRPLGAYAEPDAHKEIARGNNDWLKLVKNVP